VFANVKEVMIFTQLWNIK